MVLFSSFFLLFCCVWCISSSGLFDFYLDRCGFDFSESLLMLDGVSSFCLIMLLLCGVAALFFCAHYFSGDPGSGNSLGFMLFLFLGVMGLLVSCYGLLGTLVMWEYLGVVSFFLILFYGNLDSLRATLITLFASRFGDVCLFGLLVFVSYLWVGTDSFFVSILLLFIVLSKSACFPFISWLLEAMRAPTPVSSLVHSSTLVAAGVWFLFRYGGGFIVFPCGLDFVFFTLSLSTIFISSFCSIVFLDLKKIVALSTCNNISWCIVFFLFGDVYLGLLQLLSHGVAKCYLFISLGDLMSGSSSAQDSRGVFTSSFAGLTSVISQSILVLSLSGVPFLGVFFSKHGLLCDLFWGYSSVCFILLYFSFFLSCVYSFRFLGLLVGFSSLGVSMYGSLFLIVFISSLLSGVLNFFSSYGVDEIFLVGSVGSLSLLLVQFLGAFFGLFCYFYPIYSYFPVAGFFIWGCDSIVGFFYTMFSVVYHFFLFFLYRWEVGFCNSLSLLGFSLGVSWRSLKFLVSSGFFLIFLCFLLV